MYISAADIVKGAYEAFNAGDRARYAEFLAGDVKYNELAHSRLFEGREAVLEQIFGMWRQAYPDLHGEIVDILPDETKFGVEILWTGTHKGELVTPFGTFPPTGKKIHIPAFMVFTIKDRKIVLMHHFWDGATALWQLGIIPEKLPVPALT